MADDLLWGSKARAVQVRGAPKHGWTKARRARFLDVLAATCNVRRATAAAEMGERAAYALRRRDPAFGELWQAALEAGYERLEGELLARAIGNPANAVEPGESGEVETGPVDVDLALKLLAHHRAAAKGGTPARRTGRFAVPATMEAVEASLAKKIDALEKRLKGAR